MLWEISQETDNWETLKESDEIRLPSDSSARLDRQLLLEGVVEEATKQKLSLDSREEQDIQLR